MPSAGGSADAWSICNRRVASLMEEFYYAGGLAGRAAPFGENVACCRIPTR